MTGYPAQPQKVLTTALAWATRLENADAFASLVEVDVVFVEAFFVVPFVVVVVVVVARLTLAAGLAVTVTVMVPGYFEAQYDVAGG